MRMRMPTAPPAAEGAEGLEEAEAAAEERAEEEEEEGAVRGLTAPLRGEASSEGRQQ